MKSFPRAARPTSLSLRSRIAIRLGVTLVELLVAMAITLMLMFAVVEVFAWVGSSIDGGKATIEMSGQLRSVSQRLQNDLDNITARTVPWIHPNEANGYFEYIEGLERDRDYIAATHQQFGNLVGDNDDVLAFTVRNPTRPFVGRFNGALIESEVAEVVWWVATVQDANGNPVRMLYRRQFLVRPELRRVNIGTSDISVGLNGEANSLADLAKRENRAFHTQIFPFQFDKSKLTPLTGGELGEDVVLSNVLAFDVKAYDPLAEIRQIAGGEPLTPNDSEWQNGTAVGRGAYVDLFYLYNNGRRGGANSWFAAEPDVASGLRSSTAIPYDTWDTWPMHYERDGVAQRNGAVSGAGVADRATNGIDDDGANGTDDVGERETAPPYPFPLRGLQVKVRMFEPDSREARQVTVTANFTPN